MNYTTTPGAAIGACARAVREIAVAGTSSIVTALLADTRLDARQASTQDVLDIDD
jgi:hypothetical protein